MRSLFKWKEAPSDNVYSIVSIMYIIGDSSQGGGGEYGGRISKCNAKKEIVF